MPLGIEMEFNSFCHYRAKEMDIPGSWIARSDGSLSNGVEFVSPIIQNEHTAAPRAVDILNFAKANKARVGGYASVHIHCSNPTGFNTPAWVIWFARNIVVHDAAIAEAYTSDNRRRKYAKGFGSRVLDIANMDPATALMSDIRKKLDGDRFVGANFCALERHGTIELRYFNGTRSEKTLTKYIEVARVLNHHAMVGSIADASEFLIKGYDETPKHNWCSRGVQVFNRWEGYEPPASRTDWIDMASGNVGFCKSPFFRVAKAISESDWNGNWWEIDLQPASLRLEIRKFSALIRKMSDLGNLSSNLPYRLRYSAFHNRINEEYKKLNKMIGYSPCSQDKGKELREVIDFLGSRGGIMENSLKVYEETCPGSKRQKVRFSIPAPPVKAPPLRSAADDEWVFALYMKANPNG